MRQLVMDLLISLKTLTGLPASVNYSEQSENCIVITASGRSEDELPLSMRKEYILNTSYITIQIATSKYSTGSAYVEQIIDHLEAKRQTIGSTEIHYCEVMLSTSLYQDDQAHHVFTVDFHLKHSKANEENGNEN